MTWCSECGEAHFSTQRHRCKPGARLKARLKMAWNNEPPLRYRPLTVEAPLKKGGTKLVTVTPARLHEINADVPLAIQAA